MLKHVFISYRHEGPDHARAVRRLATLLRERGIPVELDQFYLEANPGGPARGGWPKWCEDNASASACVIIIGSPGWFSAYEFRGDPGEGLGSAAEAALFRQALYDSQGNNERIRLVMFDSSHEDSIPPRLRPWHRFAPFERSSDLENLIGWISSCLKIASASRSPVLWPSEQPFVPTIADRREYEWPLIVNLLTGKSNARILLIQAEAGLGKSTLLREAGVFAQQLGLSLVALDLRSGCPDVPSILGEFYLALGEQLPHFSQDRGGRSHLLRRDLRSLGKPVLVTVDTYEAARGNASVEEWIDRHLLSEVPTSACMAVIVAGRALPDHRKAPWYVQARHVQLSSIAQVEQWRPWVEQHYPRFFERNADLRTLVLATGGNPLMMRTLCEAISND